MKKIRTNLAVLLVLIFVFALSALLIGQDRTKPPSKYEDLGTSVRLTTTDWEVSKVAPQRGPQGYTLITSASPLLTEGFEGGAVPPTGWSVVVNNPYTWEIDSYSPYEGSYNASCFYDEDYTGTQDEWLISPSMDLSTKGSSWYVYFYWMGSYYWAVTMDNYELELWISTDGGANFNTKLWCEDDVGVFTDWTWYRVDVDLAAYLTETDVKLAWRYYGYDGAQASLDAISVDTPPVGRCCYGDPMSPTCADVTEEECTGLAGTWTYGLDCTTPCPIVGVGDDCTNPIPVTLNKGPGDTLYKDLSQTTCGRVDDYEETCLGFYDGGEDIIYELTVTSAVVVDITLDPGSDAWTGIAIDDACPPDDPCMAFSTNSGASPHGMTSVALAPGTYYIMIDSWPSPDCITSFDLIIVESPAAPDNDECEDAPVISTFPTTVYGTNIAATIDCPGLLDWNAVWYKFELPYANNDVHIDFCPTDGEIWLVGVVLYDECPPDCPNYILRTGYEWITCTSGDDNPQIWWENLPGGKGNEYWFPVYVEDVSGNPMNFGFEVSVTEWVPHYCDASGGCDEYIERVQVGTIDNSSGCDNYADYTGISTDMVIGTGYPITITIGNSYSSDVGGLWVDWNQDLDFYDAGEQITLSPGSGYGPYLGTITPPTGAVLGNTRMRVRVQYGGTPDPCGATSWGEVEDYTINVLFPNDPPFCNIAPPGPFNISEGDVLSFTITVTDPDAGDIVTITGTGIPPGAVMAPPLPVSGPSPLASTFNWATGPGDAGIYTVTFTVTDAGQLTDTCTAQITVYPNDPPLCDINPPGPFTIYDGDNVTFVVTGSDPDGDPVTITGSGIPSGATMTPDLPLTGPSPQSSSFDWTPSSAQVGVHTVNFTISDNHGFEALCDVQITVEARPIPILSQWGLLILILLIVGAGILIMMKRKKVAVRK